MNIDIPIYMRDRFILIDESILNGIRQEPREGFRPRPLGAKGRLQTAASRSQGKASATLG